MKQLLRLLLGGFSLWLATTSMAVEPAKVQKLSEHVYAISLMNYTSLVVLGEQDVLITDTANPYRAAQLKREIARLTDKPVGKIVLSHEHFDHTGGSEIFAGAKVIAQQNLALYRQVDPLELLPKQIDISFDKRLDIDMGTTLVVLHHLGIADGAAVAIVHLPTERIALSADMYVDSGMGPGVFLTDTNLLGNRLILNTLLSWDLKYAINVHSSRVDLAPLEAMAGFLNDLYDQLLPQIQQMLAQQPKQMVGNILKLSQSMQLPKYQHWPNYQDLPDYIRKMAFAMIHGG